MKDVKYIHCVLIRSSFTQNWHNSNAVTFAYVLQLLSSTGQQKIIVEESFFRLVVCVHERLLAITVSFVPCFCMGIDIDFFFQLFVAIRSTACFIREFNLYFTFTARY